MEGAVTSAWHIHTGRSYIVSSKSNKPLYQTHTHKTQLQWLFRDKDISEQSWLCKYPLILIKCHKMQIIKHDHAGILCIRGNCCQVYFQTVFDYTGSNLVPIRFQFAIKSFMISKNTLNSCVPNASSMDSRWQRHERKLRNEFHVVMKNITFCRSNLLVIIMGLY